MGGGFIRVELKYLDFDGSPRVTGNLLSTRLFVTVNFYKQQITSPSNPPVSSVVSMSTHS